MSKSFLATISFCLLSISGLSSCSKDQSSTDDLNIDPPVLHAQYRESGASFKLNIQDTSLDAKMLNAVYPTSVIEMPSLKNQNFADKPMSMDVTSSCEIAGVSRQSFVKHIANAQSFQIMNLVNPTFLVESSNTQTPATCSFEFNFQDSVGSTESFRYKDIPIAPMIREDLADFNLNSKDEKGAEFDHALAIVTENRDKNFKYPLITQTHLGYIAQPQDRILLVCEDYIIQIFARDTSEIALSQFEGAPLIWNKNLSGADPRISQSAEDCRIMHESGDINRVMKFSRQFRLVEKSADLRITATMNSQLFATTAVRTALDNDHSQEVIHLEIANPSNNEIHIGLPSVQVQFIGQNNYVNNKVIAQNIVPFVKGGQFLEQNPRTGKVISIAAGAEISVSYVFAFAGTCAITPPAPTPSQFAKIYIQPMTKLSVLQLAKTGNNTEYYKTYEDVDFGLSAPTTSVEAGRSVTCTGI